MKFFALLALVAFSAFAAASASDVVVIDGDEQFAKVVGEASAVVVEFYAPWCGHCKKLAPEYETAATALKDDGIVLANVDATLESNKALASKYGVRGYPTLKVFRNGDVEKAEDYQGPREADGIVSHLTKMFGPASKLVDSAEAATKLIDSGLAVIGVFSDAESDFGKMFMKLAEAQRDEAEFGHATDASVVAKCADTDCADKVLLFKNYDDPELVYEGEATVEAITAWLEKVTMPTLPELTKDPANRRALQKVFGNNEPKLLVMAKADYEKLDELKASVREVAGATEGVSFLFAEAGENAGALGFFGIEEADTPAWAIHDGEKNAKFIKPNAEGEDLAAWVASFKAGTLEKTIKSEPIPESNDEAVKVVVAKTFDEQVFGGQDVLIEFYAPWCGHCKKLTPIYEEVAEEFADEANVVIAKMDATANDVPSAKFDVKGFPTLYFVQGSTGKISQYGGDRSKEDLIKYVKDNMSPSEEAPKADSAKDEL